MALQAINPATGETIKTYDEMTPAEMGQIITQAHTDLSGLEADHICRTRPHDAAGRPDSA